MKKYFFFALATAGLLSSCSSDDTVAGTEVENDELVPIQIGFGGGSVSVDETRGTGTVGGYSTDADANKWHSQHFYLYMLNKGTVDLAKFKLTPTSAEEDIYNNAEFIAPGTEFSGYGDNLIGPRQSGMARPKDNKIKYYPAQDNYDFYAYRVDTLGTTIGVPVFAGDSLSVPFVINGSQDIMVAKAIPTTDEINSLKAINGNAANANRYYSSFSARHDVQPNLTFKHLLTRLTFQVMPKGNSTDAASHIVIDSIKVVTTKVKGVLTIAKVGDFNGNSQKITWEESTDSVELALMQRDSTKLDATHTNIDSLNLVEMSPIDFSKMEVGQVYPVGEALMVAPENGYLLKVYGHQMIANEYGVATTSKYNFVYSDRITKEPPYFYQGYSYNVTISLWGINQIDVTTTLTGWGQGSQQPIFEPEETKTNGFAD